MELLRIRLGDSVSRNFEVATFQEGLLLLKHEHFISKYNGKKS